MNCYRFIQVFRPFEQEYDRNYTRHKQRREVKGVSKRKQVGLFG